MKDVEKEVLRKFKVDTEPEICSEEGCEDKAEIKGKCKKHYMKEYWKNREYRKERTKTKREAKSTEKAAEYDSNDLIKLREKLQLEKQQCIARISELRKQLASIDNVLNLLKEEGKNENDEG